MLQFAPVAAPLLTLLLLAPPAPQEPAAPAAPAAKPAEQERPARPAASNRTVRLVVTITTTAESAEPLRRTATMLVLDGNRGSVRSGDQVRRNDGGLVPVGIKVDAGPQLLDDGRIRVFLSLEYSPAYPAATDSTGQARDSSGQAQVTVIVVDGKPTVVSETSDASTGRKAVVELTASVIK